MDIKKEYARWSEYATADQDVAEELKRMDEAQIEDAFCTVQILLFPPDLGAIIQERERRTGDRSLLDLALRQRRNFVFCREIKSTPIKILCQSGRGVRIPCGAQVVLSAKFKRHIDDGDHQTADRRIILFFARHRIYALYSAIRTLISTK